MKKPVEEAHRLNENGSASSDDGESVDEYTKIGESMGLSGNLIVVPPKPANQPSTPAAQKCASGIQSGAPAKKT